MRLLLFDIDGTLIRSHGAGRLALKKSLEDLFGTAGPLDTYRMSGKVDSQIITDLLTAIGVPQSLIEAKLPEIYALMAKKSANYLLGKTNIYLHRGRNPAAKTASAPRSHIGLINRQF